MSWGSKNPVNLVLGFSKGERQTQSLERARHEDVPFTGFRRDLGNALGVLGLLPAGASVDHLINASEPDWAFASAVRCTIELFDRESNLFRKSGTVLSKFAREGETSWLRNCLSAHFTTLPPRLRNVILLSNDDGWIEVCFQEMRKLHPNTRRVNEVAYATGDVMWAHIVHVGGPGKNHIKNWLTGAPGKQGAKMQAARAAIAREVAGAA